MDRLTQSLVDAHICVSQDVAAFSKSNGGLNPDRVHGIPNGVTVERVANARPANLSVLGISADSKIMLFVGRLDPQKDPLWLMNAFPAVLKKMADVHLIFAGQGPLELEMRQTIAKMHLQQKAHILGFRTDIPELLKSASVLVLPSHWEGMPNVVLEAFAAGIPVAATPVEGVSELVSHNRTGLLVRSKDANEFAELIAGLLSDPTRAARMGHSAQSLVSEKFTWEKMCESYVEIYRKLLAERQRE
jgi:glycosyltransferase involved in cell wall biosynthesis